MYISFLYIDNGCLQIPSKSDQREQFWIGKSVESSKDELKCRSNWWQTFHCKLKINVETTGDDTLINDGLFIVS